MIDARRLHQTFRDLLSINSPSLKEKALANYIKAFAKKYDLEYIEDRSSKHTGSDTNNIVIRLRGNAELEPIFFAAHMDTVEPTVSIKIGFDGEKYFTESDTILGSDDKAGIAAILEVLASLSKVPLQKRRTIEGVFTVAEEIGLVGARHFDTSILLSRSGYVLDDHDDIGRAVVAAPSHFIYECEVRGKAAHAGIEPEKGINAIKAAAFLINKIPSGRLGDYYTANIGKIAGGRASNIVPDLASFTFEVRSIYENKCYEYLEKVKRLVQLTEERYNVKCQLKGKKEYSVYKFNMNNILITRFKKACSALNIKPIFVKSTGGSDTNIFNEKGLPSLNISVGMRQVHSHDEHIYAADLEKITRLILSLSEIE